MNARSRILHPRRFAIVRDALAALWLSLLVGFCAAMTLALVVVLLASSAYAAIADEHLTAKLGDAGQGSLLLKTGIAGRHLPAPTVRTDAVITVTEMVARVTVSQQFRKRCSVAAADRDRGTHESRYRPCRNDAGAVPDRFKQTVTQAGVSAENGGPEVAGVTGASRAHPADSHRTNVSSSQRTATRTSGSCGSSRRAMRLSLRARTAAAIATRFRKR